MNPKLYDINNHLNYINNLRLKGNIVRNDINFLGTNIYTENYDLVVKLSFQTLRRRISVRGRYVFSKKKRRMI